MFKLPRVVGQTTAGQEISANVGRFGPYVQVDKTFVSIKGLDPMKISEAEARKLIAAKLKKERERIIADFGQVKVLRGPYGPYVTDGKTNAKIPKETDPKTVSEEKAKKLLADASKAPKRRFNRTPKNAN
jgi:DNA topoisomerase-1